MNPHKYLELAAQVSRLKVTTSHQPGKLLHRADDDRTYFHGAVGIRKDGVIVCSSNGNPKEPEPKHHAEARVLRKLGKGGILFVVRTLADGTWGDSKPCSRCWARIVSSKVDRVYWSASGAGWLETLRPYMAVWF